MNNEMKDMKEALRQVLSDAVDMTENRYSYVNNVQIYFIGNEVVLDLYFLGPNSKPNVQSPQAQRLHRIILPVEVAKETAELLLSGIGQLEAEQRIRIPTQMEMPLQPLETSPKEVKTNE